VLPKRLPESTRRQAALPAPKLQALGYRSALNDWAEAPHSAFRRMKLRRMAQMEHVRLMAELEAQASITHPAKTLTPI
jgi:hypothetical protein